MRAIKNKHAHTKAFFTEISFYFLDSIFGSFMTDLKMAPIQRITHFEPMITINLFQKNNIQADIITLTL